MMMDLSPSLSHPSPVARHSSPDAAVALLSELGLVLAEGGDWRRLLERSAQALVEHLGAAFAAIWTLDPRREVLDLRASAGSAADLGERYRRVPIGQLEIGRIALERRPLLTNNVPGDLRLRDREWLHHEGLVAFAGYPLLAEDRPMGVLALLAREPLADGALPVLAAVASMVARAVERKRAEEALARKAAAFAEVAATVAFSSSLQATLTSLARSAVEATGIVGCAVVVMGADQRPRYAGVHGLPERYAAGMEAAVRAGARLPSLRAFEAGATVVLRDARRTLLADPRYAPVHDVVRDAAWDTQVAVPLSSRGHVVGVLSAYYAAGHEPGRAEIDFLRTIADQAAVAVENAQLFAQAREKAALEERQRLARELHDSVSQALYGIALGARTARTLLDRDPRRAAEPLDYVLELAEAGLAEMRALIFELRPESLETEGLVAALEKQASSLRARYRLAVDAILGPEPDLPTDVKEALYRVAQEALHNTVKHARAQHVWLTLTSDADGVALEVRDDGVGFDPAGDYPGHLGLRSMRERAQQAGATLTIESHPGHGTTIGVRLPALSRPT